MRSGWLLLSRYPIAHVERIGVRGSRLGSLRATVGTPQGEVRVFVVHFHPTDPRRSPRQRHHSDALRLREATRISELATQGQGPTLVLGDFNAKPRGPEYALFSAQLRDACPGGATWPDAFPVLRIDYVWTSDALSAQTCAVASSNASDHRPVIVDLSWIEPRHGRESR